MGMGVQNGAGMWIDEGVGTGTGLGAGTRIGPGNQTGTDIGDIVGTGTGVMIGTGTGVMRGTDTGVSVGTGTGNIAGTGTGVGAGTLTGTGMGNQAGIVSETGMQTDMDTGIQTGTGTGVQTQTGRGGVPPLGGPATPGHSVLPGSSYFPLTLTAHPPPFQEGEREPEVESGLASLRPTPSLSVPRQTSSLLDQARTLLTRLIQPPQYPPQTPENRLLGGETGQGAGVGTGVGAGIPLEAGAMVKGVRGEEESREYRRRPPPRDEDVRTWHSLSGRPEAFFRTQLPFLGLNPYMRMLVHDSDFSFNPLLFCLRPTVRCYPQAGHVD
jgi:hypothetical protein